MFITIISSYSRRVLTVNSKILSHSSKIRNMHLLQNKAYVNGKWVSSGSNTCFDVVNPATEEVVGSAPDMNVADTQKAIDAAHTAFYSPQWQNLTAKDRSGLLKKWFNLMEQHRQDIAQIMTAESGKPLIESLGEVGYGNSFVEWFAEEARRINGEIIPSPVASKQIMLTKNPIGVAGLITPWNFPHAMITRKAAAALAAGCTVVIKPAEDTPLTALALAKLADEAGFPEGVINVVTCSRKHAAGVGELLCTSPLIAGISFTGSTEVGKLLYKQCSAGIKRIGLELGGNAPFIVFKSADLGKAVAGAIASKFRNCGQTCVSANRFLIQAEIHDEFVSKLEDAVRKFKIGPGNCEGVTIGPLINAAQFEKVSKIVEDAECKQAKLITGGKGLPNLGKLFYEPTILTNINSTMRVYNEEVFGPIATIIKFDTEEEALEIANSTQRGLAGYFYSGDFNQIFRVSKKLEVGMVGVNEGIISTTEAAFGGIKESGIGREGSHHGIDEFHDLDGSFFENFGQKLRQRSEFHESNLVPSNEEEKDEEEGTQIEKEEEPEEEVDPAVLEARMNAQIAELCEMATSGNVEQLYKEILFEIINNIGVSVAEGEEVNTKSLIAYVQDAFKISDEMHLELLAIAETMEVPERRLNVEVIEAKELQPKDANGLSDPFVTLFLHTLTTHRYNTSVKSSTLTPTWEEYFSIPIHDNPNDSNLIVEVWDFDPAETIKEKMTKFSEVKGVKGLKKLMKEIAVTASTGKHDNEFIGEVMIPLNTVPASGLVMWYNLTKKNKAKRQGLIKVKLNFSGEKNNQVALQEHRHLLRVLLLHELEHSQVAPFWWSGKFSAQGEAVLIQHSAQSGLSSNDIIFGKYSVYCAIHTKHELSFSLFDSLLDKIIRPIQTQTITNDEVKVFWDATKALLPSCFKVIRTYRKKTSNDKTLLNSLTDVLSIIAKISMMEPPEGTDLFPPQIYGWLRMPTEEATWDIRGALNDAIYSAANDWFNHICGNIYRDNVPNEEKLQQLIKIIQLVRTDLQKSIESYDRVFQEIAHISYSKELYLIYEEKLAELIQPTIENICKSLKRIGLPDQNSYNSRMPDEEDMNMGTTLFELFLVLKKFTLLGPTLSPGATNFKMSEYYTWFTVGVTHWLDISVFKALTRIKKAIELDDLLPVDDEVKYSSSAVDTLNIFYQIKIFWQQLDWPDVEGSYMFVAKIVDDICRCCTYYADLMAKRVEGVGDVESVYGKRFEVTQEWCLAINNIEYLRQNLFPFVKELGTDYIILKLSDCRSEEEANRCSQTIKNVVENAIDTKKNKILELVETVAKKMSPPMRKFLIEGAELLHQDSNSMDRLMLYLENSHRTLNIELNDNNFQRVFDAIWTEVGNILMDIIHNNLDKRRPPSYFSSLRDTLHLMVENFHSTQNEVDGQAFNRKTLDEIEQILELHGLETAELIHQFYKERHQEQLALKESPYGMLTVQCHFQDNVLNVEVLNGRNLMPMDDNGLCDPFVRLHFIPEERFQNIAKPKTNAIAKTLFPLFDEKFAIKIAPEQKQLKEAFLMFCMKDKDLFGISNQFIGEAFIRFGDIVDVLADSGTIKQTHLVLTRPTRTDTPCIRALENRQGDKLARDFLKKIKQKTEQKK